MEINPARAEPNGRPGEGRDNEMGDGAPHIADNNLSPQELA